MGEWYDGCVGVSTFQSQIPLAALLLRKLTQVASGLLLLISFCNSDRPQRSELLPKCV